MRYLVVAALLLVPIAAARPWVLDTDAGIAEQGSTEHWTNIRTGTACVDVVAPVRVTLTLLTASTGDVVTLTVPVSGEGVNSGNATVDSPAVVFGRFSDPCDGEFDVVGAQVASHVVYRWEITYLPHGG